MKSTIIQAIAIVAAVVLMGCTGGSDSKKFSPTDRTTSPLTDEEREAAIAAKKAQLEIDPVQMMQTRTVKLSVLPPAPEGDITEDLSEHIAAKMVQIIASGGLGGLNTAPGFALTATLSTPRQETTGTAPQRMLVQYEVYYAVMNLSTGDVYAACSERISGAGRSWEEARANAVLDMKCTPALKQMLDTGSERIIAWFNDNLSTFKSQVDAACGRSDYALALALIESVPEQATEAFQYAQGRHADVLQAFGNAVANDELAALKAVLSTADGSVPPEAHAHLALLPNGSPQQQEARQAIADCEARIASARSDAQAAADREAQRAHERELADIEAARLRAQYEAEATARAAVAAGDRCRGFWSSLGVRVLDGIDKLTSQTTSNK